MSTNNIKLYNKEDILQAQQYLKKAERYFTKKTTRRKTVQVRISEKWYQKIKDIAGTEKIMLSFFLDRICEHFFKHYE
ncbi:MAG: hypothetical protein WAW13_01375 [Minisyncoccia bacterium]